MAHADFEYVQPEATLVPCPVCGQETDRVKQHRYMTLCVFLVTVAVWEWKTHRACPKCMRRFVGWKCLLNLIPGNLLWFVLMLPWALGLVVASYRSGHSLQCDRSSGYGFFVMGHFGFHRRRPSRSAAKQ